MKFGYTADVFMYNLMFFLAYLAVSWMHLYISGLCFTLHITGFLFHYKESVSFCFCVFIFNHSLFLSSILLAFSESQGKVIKSKTFRQRKFQMGLHAQGQKFSNFNVHNHLETFLKIHISMFHSLSLLRPWVWNRTRNLFYKSSGVVACCFPLFKLFNKSIKGKGSVRMKFYWFGFGFGVFPSEWR